MARGRFGLPSPCIVLLLAMTCRLYRRAAAIQARSQRTPSPGSPTKNTRSHVLDPPIASLDRLLNTPLFARTQSARTKYTTVSFGVAPPTIYTTARHTDNDRHEREEGLFVTPWPLGFLSTYQCGHHLLHRLFYFFVCPWLPVYHTTHPPPLSPRCLQQFLYT